MPVFNGRGLVPPVPSGAPVTMAPVNMSSDESHEGEEEEEEEERNSEATHEGEGETSPMRKANILRTLPDDDDEADVPLERSELHAAGGSSRSKANPRRRSPAAIPTRGRSTLISRDDAPVLMLPVAASNPPATSSSIPGARTPAPQATKLSGFKLRKQRDYTAVDN